MSNTLYEGDDNMPYGKNYIGLLREIADNVNFAHAYVEPDYQTAEHISLMEDIREGKDINK